MKVQLRQLPEAQRIALAQYLWDSLDAEPAEEELAGIRSEWNAVVRKRVEEIKNGTVKGHDVFEVFDAAIAKCTK